MKRIGLISLVAVTSLLSSCAGYPRLLNFPFDPGGRSLNSRASELSPQLTSEYIVFVSDRNGSQDVYLYDANNRSLIDLPGLNSLDEIASDPSISENGRYLVFAASLQGRSQIYLYDREFQQKRSLTQNIQGEVRNPTISADGSTIAFEVATDGQWDILVYDRSGQPLDLP
ncbi:MAG: TolB family protein [Moorea sp. SIO2B7]|nr:TolB family protein [Moorena sp. SIO2B7]